ncbi:MAG: heparinase II/III family protein, partial [Gammaproteobacteria bacterium]
AYDSTLQVIQRILALQWAWAFLAGAAAEDADALAFEYDVLQMIYADARFLTPRLGNATPNNHLLADYFAGWLLGCVFPELIVGGVNPAQYEERWLKELARQTYADGWTFEHSGHYHEFACMMGATYILLCRANQRAPNAWALEQIRTMLRLHASAAGREGVPLTTGNAIDDLLFALGGERSSSAGVIYSLYRELFAPQAPPLASGQLGQETVMWLTAKAPGIVNTADEILMGSTHHHEGGLFILCDSISDSKLIFRTGPAPGTAVYLGHAHADLLSIALFVNGRSVLVDPGTYTYRADPLLWAADEPAWRRYFQGPVAHNGLTITGVDPWGATVSDFRAPASATRVASRASAVSQWLQCVSGTIQADNAYDAVSRTVVSIDGHYWVIVDRFPRELPDGSTLGFQFASEFELKTEPGATVAVCGDSRLTLRSGGDLDPVPRVLNGSTEPLGGWISRRYGAKTPAAQLRFDVRNGGRLAVFLLATEDELDSDARLTVNVVSGGIAVRYVGPRHQDQLWIADPASNSVVSEEGHVIGDAGWIRVVDGNLSEMRWLNGIECCAHGITGRSRGSAPALWSRAWWDRADGLHYQSSDKQLLQFEGSEGPICSINVDEVQ